MKIKLAEEVKHLTLEELEELYERYISGEKNQELMEEYGIDAHPNKLVSLFPPVIHESLECAYCALPLFYKRKSKSGSSYSMEYFCIECNHKEGYHYNRPLECNCLPCSEKRAEAVRAKLAADLEKISQEYNLDKKAMLSYLKLSFSHKCYLLSLFLMQSESDLNHIKSLNNSGSAVDLSPTSDFDNEIILKLHRDGAIAVDPSSPFSAFDSSDDFKSFYYRDVLWVVNVSLDGSNRLSLGELFKLVYVELRDGIQIEWEEDLKELVFRLAEEEVVTYLDVCLEQLQLPEAPKKTNEVIKEILNDFSVSEIYYFIKKATENAHLFYAKGKAESRKHAVNTIPSKILYLATRASNEGWDVYKYNRTYSNERSQLNIVLFDFVIGGGDDIAFYKSPEVLWNNELYKMFDSSKSTKESSKDTSCVICGSVDIIIKTDKNSLTLLCTKCGELQQFYASKN
ncbi:MULTISPECIES: hypothetical protein [Photobacterium]|uniref:Uncharacterized protein n=1 Tax=Photobacterium carnosum TaxID=2023717 RepID=A0A2N4USD9_9GAMM|nr:MULTISPECIES: hypothetical protein [Photobacterium]PLC57920.1 hypothetical protein CIK00_10710 [Photobacterium carnosum]PST96336.1 hypothetical protein C9I87_04885 [Photobacterium iliopiscarium]